MALPGATTPTVSPAWSAGGLMRALGEVGGFFIFWRSPSILNEKFSPADELRRTIEEDFFVPAYGLDAAGRAHFHRRFRPSRGNGGNCGRARSRTRRQGLAYSALKDAGFDQMPAHHPHQLDIDAVLEIVMAADLRGFGLPAGRELIHKDHEMWIAHENRHSRHFAE